MYILDTSRLIYAAAKKIGRILKEIAIIIAQLLIGLIILAASKARSHVKPAIIQLVRWSKEKTIVYVTMAKPKVIEAGHMSKGLLIVAIGKVKTTEGVGKPKAIQEVQAEKKSSTRLGKVTQRIKEQVSKAISKGDYETSLKQQQITTDTTANKISAEIILEQGKTMNLNETLAKEISQNRVGCKATIDRDSLPIEKGPYYSHFFPMSPRIVTNRGCIKLEGNGTRNIDFIQIIQKN
jgi:hypothetical protein